MKSNATLSVVGFIVAPLSKNEVKCFRVVVGLTLNWPARILRHLRFGPELSCSMVFKRLIGSSFEVLGECFECLITSQLKSACARTRKGAN
jgi:hypothetical protein